MANVKLPPLACAIFRASRETAGVISNWQTTTLALQMTSEALFRSSKFKSKLAPGTMTITFCPKREKIAFFTLAFVIKNVNQLLAFLQYISDEDCNFHSKKTPLKMYALLAFSNFQGFYKIIRKVDGLMDTTLHSECCIYQFGKSHVWAFPSLILVFSLNSKEALY